jgi:predicted DNA-binding transcriptional regulator AlpA
MPRSREKKKLTQIELGSPAQLRQRRRSHLTLTFCLVLDLAASAASHIFLRLPCVHRNDKLPSPFSITGRFLAWGPLALSSCEKKWSQGLLFKRARRCAWPKAKIAAWLVAAAPPTHNSLRH